MRNKRIILVVSLLCILTISLCACSTTPQDPNEDKLKIDWMFNDIVLKTSYADKNSTVVSWNPKEENYSFVRWCADKDLTTAFNFDQLITENTKIYGEFKGPKVEDTRDWYLTGLGKGTLLNHNLDVQNLDESLKLNIIDDPNTNMHIIENISLFEGDKFFFCVKNDWSSFHAIEYVEGYDKVSKTVSLDGEVFFEADNTTTDADKNYIVVRKSGVYKFYLSTNPKEERYDKITFVRTSDVVVSENMYNMHVRYEGNNWGEDEGFVNNNKYKLKKVPKTDNEYYIKLQITEADYKVNEQYAEFDIYNSFTNKAISSDGTLENNTFKLKAGTYHIKYTAKVDTVEVKELGYYIIGTFIDTEGNKIYNVIKDGITPKLELVDGLYEASLKVIDVTDVYTEEIDKTKGVMNIYVAYGSEIKREQSFYDPSSTRDPFCLFASEYKVTFDSDTNEVIVTQQ